MSQLQKQYPIGTHIRVDGDLQGHVTDYLADGISIGFRVTRKNTRGILRGICTPGQDKVEVLDRPETATEPQQLRVWWIPQVPGKPFHVPVSSVAEGAFVINLLADYDQFQLDNRIKGDYANCGGLQVWEEDEWVEWEDPETGGDITEYEDA